MGSGSAIAAFLFTDIVGSTELWEAHPAEMAEALEEHDRILREEIDKRSGHIFSTAGDSFAAAFSSAVAAMESAVATQLRVKDVSVAGQGLAVRSAVHLGEAQLRDGDYFGPTVNRSARLMAVAHGGQILASDAAVRVSVAAGAPIDFKELGEHQLKGLRDAERVHQVIDDRLAIDFPGLQTSPAYRTNLPAQAPSLFGRQEDCRQLMELIEQERLVTIVGPAGAGKTRLAVQVAIQWLEQNQNDAWIADLTPIEDAEQVPETLVRVLPIQWDANKPPTAVAAEYLRHREAMVVIDNCEHMLEAVFDLTSSLLAECPGLRLLTTSRERINVAEEQVFRLEPLETPTADRSFEDLVTNPAVQLFLDRARRSDPSFDVTEANHEAVANICRLLDGLPLAIELAASRASVLAPHQLEEMLSMRFRLLETGQRDAQPHHRTLLAALDWSHELLDDPDRLLFARLAVFPHTFALTDGLGVCADDRLDELTVLEGLGRLLEKSLLRKTSSGRFVLLETIRLYATQKLDEVGERTRFLRRHAEHFASLLDAISEQLEANESDAFSTYEEEQENILAALRWCVDAKETTVGLRLYGSLRPFWWSFGQPAKAVEWGSKLIGDEPDRTINAARALHTAGTMSYRIQPELASQFLTRAEEVLRSLDHPDAGAELSRVLISSAGHLSGDYDAVEAACSEALELAEAADDKVGQSIALMNLSVLFGWRGDSGRSTALGEEGLDRARAAGQPSRIAEALETLGRAEIGAGQLDSGREHLAEALTVAEQSSHLPTLIAASQGLLELALVEGDLKSSTEAARRAVEHMEKALPDTMIQLLVDIGRLLLRLGQPEMAGVVIDRVDYLVGSSVWEPFDELKSVIDEIKRDVSVHDIGKTHGLITVEALKGRLLEVLSHDDGS